MLNIEQIYGQIKKHEWKEEITSYGTKDVLPLVFEAKCSYMPEKNIVTVFYPGYPMREGRAHVRVYLKKPDDGVGKSEQIVMYCSYEKWFKHFRPGDPNEPIPESPFDPFIPVAEMDNTMAYMDEDGMIEVLTEDGAAEWGRKYIDVCRDVLKEETDPGYLEAAHEALDNKEIEEDFRNVIAIYTDYESYIRHHYPQWEELPDDAPLPKWLTEEEKTTKGFRWIRRATPIKTADGGTKWVYEMGGVKV